ncbi:MAG: DNA recombination/repair protein RecA, partial [Bryobacteraceae bacterium]|nr:DNA recombination/repair protein RecA [Bryobacteraceae bacterium]
QHNVLEKTGSWFSYKGERIGQGRENARQFLKDHPEIRDRIEMDLRRLLGLIRVEEPAPEPPPARPASVPAGRSR